MFDDDLPWLAFRYVTGEMTADEEARFEQRLADDQAAREAVEQAVELHEAVRMVSSEPVPRRSVGVRHLAWLGAAAAAAILVSVGLNGWRTSAPLSVPGTVPAPTPAADSATVAAWAELQRTQVSDHVVFGTAHVDALAPMDAAMEVFDNRDESLPSWLLAAVAAETRNKENK